MRRTIRPWNVAAALLKMAMGDDNEDIIDNYLPARSLDDLDSFGRGRGRERSGVAEETAEALPTALQ